MQYPDFVIFMLEAMPDSSYSVFKSGDYDDTFYISINPHSGVYNRIYLDFDFVYLKKYTKIIKVQSMFGKHIGYQIVSPRTKLQFSTDNSFSLWNEFNESVTLQGVIGKRINFYSSSRNYEFDDAHPVNKILQRVIDYHRLLVKEGFR